MVAMTITAQDSYPRGMWPSPSSHLPRSSPGSQSKRSSHCSPCRLCAHSRPPLFLLLAAVITPHPAHSHGVPDRGPRSEAEPHPDLRSPDSLLTQRAPLQTRESSRKPDRLAGQPAAAAFEAPRRSKTNKRKHERHRYPSRGVYLTEESQLKLIFSEDLTIA